MKQLLALSLVSSLVACAAFLGTGPHVPTAYQGTVKVTVANASDAEMCIFGLMAGNDQGENWLGDKSKAETVLPGAQRSFDVKPGNYHVVAGLFLARDRGGSCSGEHFLAGGGTGPNATVAITGPALIAIGPKATAPVAGAQRITLPNFFNETGGASSGESAAPEEAPAAEEAPSSSSSTPQSSPTPTNSNKSCRASGATCEQSYECCSEACLTHSPNNYCR